MYMLISWLLLKFIPSFANLLEITDQIRSTVYIFLALIIIYFIIIRWLTNKLCLPDKEFIILCVLFLMVIVINLFSMDLKENHTEVAVLSRSLFLILVLSIVTKSINQNNIKIAFI